MFKNVGYKIMALTRVLIWFCFILVIAIGLISFFTSGDILALLALVAALLLIPIAWFIYGFGQLIQEVHMILEKINEFSDNNQIASKL